MLRVLIAITLWAAATAYAGPQAYIVGAGDGLVVIDTDTATVARNIKGTPGMRAIALGQSGSRAYLSGYLSNSVQVVDAATGAIVSFLDQTTSLNEAGLAINAAGTRLYATQLGYGFLCVYDTTSGAELVCVPVGKRPYVVALDPTETFAYVSNWASNDVSVVNLVTYATEATIPVGTGPIGLVVAPDRRTLYVANTGSQTLSVVNLESNMVVDTISLKGVFPAALAMDPTGAQIFVTADLPNGEGRLLVVQAATSQVLGSIAVGSGPSAVSVAPAGNHVYVINSGTASVTVIDTATHTRVKEIEVGGYPHGQYGANFIVPAPPKVQNRIAVEFYHSEFDHYFLTNSLDEIAKLDSGWFTGWKRTLSAFEVFAPGTPGTDDVCRFFSAAFAPRSSHFYTSSASECAKVTNDPVWTFESTPFAFAPLTASGTCSTTGGRLLYRYYNNGQSGAPNHRYTPFAGVFADTTGGWRIEGAVGCVPR